MRAAMAALAAASILACSSGGGSAASTGGGQGIGVATAAAGASSGSHSAAASQSASAAAGSTGTGGTGAGSIGTTSGGTLGSSGTVSGGSTGGSTSGGDVCASEFQPCSSNGDCDCDLVCVLDSAFVDPFTEATQAVCERPCASSAQCLNAETSCASESDIDGGAHLDACAIAECGSSAGAGSGCSAAIVTVADGGLLDAGLVDAGPGTCVPQSGVKLSPTANTLLLCLPAGTATSCDMFGDENPLFSAGGAFLGQSNELQAGNAESRDPSALCPLGQACVDGGCAALCKPQSSSCTGKNVCVSQDSNDTSWGFCLPCGSSGDDGGSPAGCNLNGDCCERNCSTDKLCQP